MTDKDLVKVVSNKTKILVSLFYNRLDLILKNYI